MQEEFPNSLRDTAIEPSYCATFSNVRAMDSHPPEGWGVMVIICDHFHLHELPKSSLMFTKNAL